jgi:signal transduction histidine kinase
MLHDLVSQADRMDDRISKMFQFSRPPDLRLHQTTVQELVAAAERETRALLAGRHIQLVVEDLTDQTTFLLDSEQLSSVLAELLTNAAHHSPEASSITLRAEVALAASHPRRRLQIQVIDHGAGMAPATLEKAFDLFFTSRPDGTGMGLALARRIVEKHGGTITLASQPGAGTTAVVNLPASLPENEPGAPSRSRVDHRHGGG